jgi:hypothetical protein
MELLHALLQREKEKKAVFSYNRDFLALPRKMTIFSKLSALYYG